MSLRERLGFELPIVQAGMGGGIATGQLAGTVSAAGGLGTVGILPPAAMETELRLAMEIAGDRPVSANLLLPFTRRAHLDLIGRIEVPVVVLHGGIEPRLISLLAESGSMPVQTVGTRLEAERALGYGAAGLVIQGREAGGHLVGVEPAEAALAAIREVAGEVSVWLAGGVADGADAERVLGSGADAAVAGTRFLLSDECGAHPAYKQRVLDADRTIETMLFGMAWPMRHRVVPNAATERWARKNEMGPAALRALYRVSPPLARLPARLTASSHRRQRPGMPLFGPAAPLEGDPERLVDSSALYAGETAKRIDSILPAADAVALLAGRHL